MRNGRSIGPLPQGGGIAEECDGVRPRSLRATASCNSHCTPTVNWTDRAGSRRLTGLPVTTRGGVDGLGGSTVGSECSRCQGSKIRHVMEKWQTIAVLTPGSLPPGAIGDVEVGTGVLLRTLTPAFREKQVADFLLRVHGENRDFWRAEHCFVTEYEASSLGEPDPTWRGMTARGKQDVALDRIRCANMALWISMASGIGFSLVVDLAAENGKDEEWLCPSFTGLPRRCKAS
jgi:hypothetical protein